MPWVPVSIKGSQVDPMPFEDVATALKDMSEPLMLVGARLVRGVEEAFATQGASGDRPWARLTPAYAAWKTVRGPGVPMLVGLRRTGSKGAHPQTYTVSGQMKKQLLDPAAVHVTPHTMTYTPFSDIAGLHQEGTERMAARPPVPVPEKELLDWDMIFSDWMNNIFDAAHL